MLAVRHYPIRIDNSLAAYRAIRLIREAGDRALHRARIELMEARIRGNTRGVLMGEAILKEVRTRLAQ